MLFISTISRLFFFNKFIFNGSQKNEKENHKEMTRMVYREKKQQLLVQQCKFSAVLLGKVKQ